MSPSAVATRKATQDAADAATKAAADAAAKDAASAVDLNYGSWG